MSVQLRREVSREEFDDATVLFLFEGGAEHLPVFHEVCRFVLGTSGLVFLLIIEISFPMNSFEGTAVRFR